MSNAQNAKQGAQTLSSIVLSVALGFAIQIISARSLGAAGKGMLDLAGASSGLFTLLLGGSLQVVLAHLVAQYQATPKGFVGYFTLWSVITGGGVALLLGSAPDFIRRIGLLPEGESSFWIGYIATMTMLGIWSIGLRGILRGQHAIILLNRLDVGCKLILLTGFFLMSASGTASVPFFAYLSLAVALALPACQCLALSGPSIPIAGLGRTLFRLSIPVHGTNILAFLNQRADLFFLQAYFGAHEVAVYAIAVSIAQLVLTLSSIMALPLLPSVSAAPDLQQAADDTARSCRIYLVMALAACAGLALTMPLLIGLIFGKDFIPASTLILLLLPGMVAIGLSNIMDSFFIGSGRSRSALKVSMVALLATIAGNLTLTAWLGATGAAVAASAAYLLAGSYAACLFTRQTNRKLESLILPTRADLQAAKHMIAAARI
jgi:O-antigen/teichoic acid export membrane protein